MLEIPRWVEYYDDISQEIKILKTEIRTMQKLLYRNILVPTLGVDWLIVPATQFALPPSQLGLFQGT